LLRYQWWGNLVQTKRCEEALNRKDYDAPVGGLFCHERGQGGRFNKVFVGQSGRESDRDGAAAGGQVIYSSMIIQMIYNHQTSL